MSEKCDFGLIGLAVMGENLALNVESRGYQIAVFNRTTEKVDQLIEGRIKRQTDPQLKPPWPLKVGRRGR